MLNHWFIMDMTAPTSQFPYLAVAVLGVGFIFAVTLGSVAWYNSRRPVGWEDKERPDFIPRVDK